MKSPNTSTERPRLLAPVDRPREVSLLAEAGADELYGGVYPRDWPAGQMSPNQRTFTTAQFGSEEEFAAAAALAVERGIALYLALNAPLYDPSTYASLIGLARRAVDWGVAGVIAGDLGLLQRLAESELALRIVLSTMAGAMNRETISFYRQFALDRVVLPRHLSLAEMAALAAAHPDLAFEAFVLIGRCPNEEAYCSFQHVSPEKRWPCEIPYVLSDGDGNALGDEHPLERWHASWRQADRRLGCGLCGIPALLQAGVHHFKLVGRGGPTPGKVANVQLVRGFLDGSSEVEGAPAAYARRFGRPCHSLTCYFPELHPERR